MGQLPIMERGKPVACHTDWPLFYMNDFSRLGLVVPHLVRMIAGPGHRLLLPASALGGAVCLLAADLLARTAVNYAELPLGMVTAAVGGPFFFWLLHRTRRTAGGWG